MPLSERLKTERKRTGYTQASIAEAIGASERSLQDWERGVSAPNAVYLAAMAGLGLDVTYVLTGQKPHESAARLISQAGRASVGQGPEVQAAFVAGVRAQATQHLADLALACDEDALDILVRMATRLAAHPRLLQEPAPQYAARPEKKPPKK